MHGQNTGNGNGIDDFATQHPASRFGNGIPPHRHVGFFVMGFGPAHLAQSGGQIDPHRFVAEARRGVQIDQHLPGAGLQPDLLPQLPGGREMRWLPSDVEQPRGQFPKPPTIGVAVLINHRDVAVVVHRHNGYGTEVLDDLTRHNTPTRHPHLVPT
ncbi:Uncharacterised protein [Mycobacterium tuberculosis]|uniref:Uncharacterized protein n=1 Tax=Mycobacterium tuberculosis TaxID=1773 RepID=A0A916LES3_MYCTX|nr:Uncharacterised protein [Mycobacterium tuberculosis]